jgi:hypothetical protein
MHCCRINSKPLFLRFIAFAFTGCFIEAKHFVHFFTPLVSLKLHFVLYCFVLHALPVHLCVVKQTITPKTKNMKQIFTLILLSATLLAKSAPANNHSVKPSPVQAFEAVYGTNKTANWTCTSQGCQVEFEHKGQYITAVYNNAGKLRFYKKHIASLQLPVTLQLGLKNAFANYWIADVEEKSGKNGTTYVLTLENGYKKLTLNADRSTWQTIKTTNKA